MAEEKNHELIRPHERLNDDPHTDIKTPSVVAATENPRHIIREYDGVRESREWGANPRRRPRSNTLRAEAPA